MGIVDLNDRRLELARGKKFVDQVFDGRAEDYRTQIKHAEPEKFTHVIECTGTASGIKNAMNCIRNGGRIVTMGIHDDLQQFNTLRLLLKEIEIVPSAFFTPDEFSEVLELMDSGKLDLEDCITDIRGFSQVQESFEEIFKEGNYTQLKILIDPTRP